MSSPCTRISTSMLLFKLWYQHPKNQSGFSEMKPESWDHMHRVASCDDAGPVKATICYQGHIIRFWGGLQYPVGGPAQSGRA